MQAFIFLVVIGLVSCDIRTDTQKSLDKVLGDIKEGSKYAKHLKDVLEAPNSKYLDLIEDDIKEYVLNFIRSHFHSTVQEVALKLHVADSSAEKLILRIAGLEQGLKLGSNNLNIPSKVKEIEELLSQILGKSGGKLHEDVKEIMKKVTDPKKLETELIQKLTSSKIIEDIRSYVENLPEEIEEDLGMPIKKLVKTLSDSEIADLIKHIISPRDDRSIFDFFDRIRTFFKDLGTKISSKFSAFADWAQEHWSSALEKVKKASGSFTALAKEFIIHGKDITVSVAKQAYAFFMAHKAQIGKFVLEKAVFIAIAAAMA